ncbi:MULTISPECIES: hypothetical protein [unclassified Streptomyces]|uniref:hypothetical protein n=1 Tax=unclassified Streptomyces TaxID=2593676 RepID=UPI002E2E322A|nr:hypothetical protein [Streptomyces sp. NBC_00223]
MSLTPARKARRASAAPPPAREQRAPVGVFPRTDLVPYIAQWSGEVRPGPRVVARRRGAGIGYADEKPYDRDSDSVLWARVPSMPGRGRPEYGQVHALRQRRAMGELLCQVCGGPADRDGDGVLWLLGEDPADPASWPSDLLTTHPPLCVPCAAASVRACPHLRGQYAVLRVRRFALAGVRGVLYAPGRPEPLTVDTVGVAFDDPRIAWVRAGQLIMRLHDFTLTTLDSATG